MPVKDAFLAGVLAHVPEAERGKAEAKLIELEEGGLRQSDYSKLAADAQAEKERFEKLYEANTAWFEEKKTALAEIDPLRAKVTELEGRKPTVDLPKDVITEKSLNERLDLMERGAVGFIAEANALTMKHFQQFGEILNMQELLADKRVQTIGLQGVYADKFKDQIKAKADAAEAVRAEALREEGRVAERTKYANRAPYPVVGNEPSALDGIEAARAGEQPKVKSVEDMSAEYARLGGARATGAGV